MNPQAFALERYFARYEFDTRYLLCSSDPESMPVRELLALEPGTDRRAARRLARLHRIARQPGTAPGDRRAVRAARRRRRFSARRSARTNLRFYERRARTGRSRRRASSRVSIALFDRRSCRRRGHALGIAPGRRRRAGSRRPRTRHSPKHARDRYNESEQSDRLRLRPGTAGRNHRDRAQTRTLALRRRGLSRNRARPGRSRAGRLRSLRTRHFARRDGESLRTCRTAHRLDRDPRLVALRSNRGVQGLSDDLQSVAERIPGDLGAVPSRRADRTRPPDYQRKSGSPRRVFPPAYRSAGTGGVRGPEPPHFRATSRAARSASARNSSNAPACCCSRALRSTRETTACESATGERIFPKRSPRWTTTSQPSFKTRSI